MQLNGSALNVEELNGGTSFVTLELNAAALTFIANSAQVKRTVSLQQGSLDFSRQVMQFTTVNNLVAVAFNLTPNGVSAAQGATLSTAVFDFGVGAFQLANRNQLSTYAFDLAGQPTQAGASVNLSAAILDMAGIPLSPTKIVALDTANLKLEGQTATPVSVVTLAPATLTFVALDVTPANKPLGTVLELNPATFDFVQNSLRVTNGITLDLALFNLVPAETQNSAFMRLTASDMKLTPQSVTVVQVPVVVDLTTAIFDFTQGSLQLTGLSSAGDRKRMLFGVGR